MGRWLLRWGLGDTDARVLESELEEASLDRASMEGQRAASRWLRRELRHATLRALAFRLRRGRRTMDSHGVALGGKGAEAGILGDLQRDVRFGGRFLWRRPLFAGLVIGTLGLGIGASTTVFSLVDGVLLRDLPFQRSEELVNVWKTFPRWRGRAVVGEAWDKVGLTWDEYLVLRDGTETLEALGIHKARTMTLTGVGDSHRLVAGQANPDLLPLLGATTILGRSFGPDEEGPGARRVTVLSHSLWASRFGSDPQVLGRMVQLDGEAFEVVGVLQEDIKLPSTIWGLLEAGLDGGARALWVPINFDMAPPGEGHRGSQDLEAVGRLTQGATLDRLRTELDRLVREGRSVEELGFRLTALKEEIVGGHRASLELLLAASGLLLFIACVNIAVLLLSEAVGRRREVATRMALGAGRIRILRQLMIEGLILGLSGSLLGLVLSLGGIRGFLALGPALPRLDEVGTNLGALLFSIVAGVGTGILFGLVPAMSLRGGSLGSGQTLGARGVAGGGGRLQRALLATEIAMTLVLLVSGGLLTRSLMNLTSVDPGFDEAAVATVRVHLPRGGPEEQEANRRTLARMIEEVRGIPGVESVGAVDYLPFPGRITGSELKIPGGEGREEASLIARHHTVTPGYLEAMGVRLLLGRLIESADVQEEGDGAAVINDLLARRYWPRESPLGSRVLLDGNPFVVVGVVGDVRERHLAEEPKPMLFKADSRIPRSLNIVAKGRSEGSDLIESIRGAVRLVAPGATISRQTTIPALVTQSASRELYRTALVSVFGILATLLAAIGVFGITAHSVSKRTRELGIRMVVGAEGRELVRTVAGGNLVPILAGVGGGLLGALAVTRLMAGYLFGVSAWDVPTFVWVTGALVVLSVAAAAIPAARAGRVDPIQVLREE